MKSPSTPPQAPVDARPNALQHAGAPFVSFIVCTRDRAHAIRACLQSIETAALRHPETSAELIVVDNASRDGTAQVVAAFAAGAKLKVKLLRAPRPGLSAARNVGLAAATGRVLAFTDDDCELHPSYLADLARHYAAGEACIVRGGRVELGDAADLPLTIKVSDAVERLARDIPPGGFILGCNMTLHREAARRIGTFDERFGAGGALRAGEDTDYLIRASLAGIPVEYVPDMGVIHRHGRRTWQAMANTFRAYSVGNGALVVKHFRTAPWLLRQFYWSVKMAFKELLGGPRLVEELGVSHWRNLAMNVVGAAAFARVVVADRIRAASCALGAPARA